METFFFILIVTFMSKLFSIWKVSDILPFSPLCLPFRDPLPPFCIPARVRSSSSVGYKYRFNLKKFLKM